VQSTEIRELIIQCLSRMIAARVHNIKSGRKCGVVVFTIGASDSHESLVSNTFVRAEAPSRTAPRG
jgi:brefeldin A-inhibited guanine nucleotide-exchange protein